MLLGKPIVEQRVLPVPQALQPAVAPAVPWWRPLAKLCQVQRRFGSEMTAMPTPEEALEECEVVRVVKPPPRHHAGRCYPSWDYAIQWIIGKADSRSTPF